MLINSRLQFQPSFFEVRFLSSTSFLLYRYTIDIMYERTTRSTAAVRQPLRHDPIIGFHAPQ